MARLDERSEELLFREHPEYFSGKAPRRVSRRRRARAKQNQDKTERSAPVKGKGRVRVITEWREE